MKPQAVTFGLGSKEVGDYFPVLYLELCCRHCLLLKTTPNDSEQHDSNDGNHSQEEPVKIKLTYHAQLCRAGRVFPLSDCFPVVEPFLDSFRKLFGKTLSVDDLRACLFRWCRRTVIKTFLNVFRKFSEIDFRE